MKSEHFLKEGFVEDAHEVHQDHEVQMAREECYHAAENSIALHKLLRHVSEQQGLEGWVSAKITLANDYLKTVREYLEYELMTGGTDQSTDMINQTPVAEMLPVAESEKNPHTSALGKALHRDLSKEKKASPQQVQRNKERWAKRQAEREQGVTEATVNEMSAGGVATVVNPTPKNKAKVGSLFGGTYKQPKKAK